MSEAASVLEVGARQSFIESASGIITPDDAAKLFDLLNQIAVLPYEEASNSGLLVLCQPSFVDGALTLRFEVPFEVNNIRGVRKMLQVSDEEFCLLSDGRMVHGFGTTGTVPRDALTVQFHHHGMWDMWELHGSGRVLTRVSVLGERSLPRNVNRERFISEARRTFGELPGDDVSRLWDLISSAGGQMRGTNVLISEQAAAEAARLQPQGTRVKPTTLTPAMMQRITSIDGTVIIDTKGVCHAIGMILDGPASERGDRTRGGRFNSALMYIDSSPFRSLIVVISQDGMVDLVCRGRDSRGK